LTNWEAALKRAMDLLLSIAGVLLLLPLLLAIALAILLLDGRPVIFAERRMGYGLTLFTLYKFRTLNESNLSSSVATSDDPRLTVSGGFLRRWHLDELLQLANVIRGEMSLVGPRPMKPSHAKTLPEETLSILLSVKPGLTGPASLMFMAEDNALSGYEDVESLYLTYVLPAKAACQLEYVHNYSLLLDLKLIMQTMRDILSARAYAVSQEKVRSLLPPAAPLR
jgi:lipopolysaccharide/colanic/teichoic acid biosynthesis glycosyltransferase